jgi:hypothetical protein
MNRGAAPRATNRRVLAALLAGALLGAAVALLLQATMARTVTPLSPLRALWQLGLLALAGGLSGFALSTVTALQAADPDPEYHRPRRRQPPRPWPSRPPLRRRPPEQAGGSSSIGGS